MKAPGECFNFSLAAFCNFADLLAKFRQPGTGRLGVGFADDLSDVFYAACAKSNKIGPSRFCCSGIIDISDVQMVQQSQGLAFCLETRDHALQIHAGLDSLQRYPPSDGNLLLS